ncbi:Ig-like domain-containing protein [Cohnella panacarvi]|uniref:Ig-like domain-containing protein n=1 Tax=Cohnella panacarvi TaxID=400776 RepID=UPI0004B28E6D|nr:Ig-like domain-containing protein [Cohnella panacarvi]
MAQKALSLYLAVFLILSNYTFIIGSASAASSSVSSEQSITTTILSGSVTSDPPAGVYWTQLDNGKFHATWDNSWGKGEITVNNAGSSSSPYPAEGVVPDEYDYGGQIPTAWADYEGKPITKSLTSGVKIYDIVFDTSKRTFTPAVDPVPVGDTVAKFKTTTGGSSTISIRTPIAGGKYQVLYETPVKIKWAGQLTETKKIAVSAPATAMKVGGAQQLDAKIQTKAFTSSYFGSPVSVRSDMETTWTSSDPSIVSVASKGGNVQALKKGTATITATWTKPVLVDQLVSVSQPDGSVKLTVNKGFPETYLISNSVTLTVGEEPGPEPTPTTEPPTYAITGDFDVLPSNSINWRDTYTLKPKNFVIPNGCTYQYHEYQMISDGVYWYSGKVTSRTADSTYSYANYPYNLVVGSNNISIKVVADCADSGWIADKVLTVNVPAGNNPPVFNPGFFKQYDRGNINPLYEVVVGNRVDLRIMNNPMTDPEEPYDPDGDPISYTWEFAGSASSWIRNIGVVNDPYIHEESYNNMLADELGNHCVYVTGRDPYGGSTRKQACINVVPPNPVPIIDAPSEVVEGRPLAFPISGARSYSPMGRTIDHSRDIWTNKRDKYMTPGTETITLEVFDSAGLKSLSPAAHSLKVKPDLPPIPQLEFVPITLRNVAVEFTNTTYSPDNDEIVINTVSYRYDSDNDGNFAEESSYTIMSDDDVFMFTPTKVGKYSFTVFAQEDWGKTAKKDFILSVINESPEVDFSALSVNPEPPEITVLSPTMNTLMTSSEWHASSPLKASVSKEYNLNVSNNTLETRGMGHVQPYKGLTANNVVISKQEIQRGYCGQCGNQGSVSGYYFDFSSTKRIGESLWLAQGGNGSSYAFFFNENGTFRHTGYGQEPVLSSVSIGNGYVTLNPNAGRIWVRENPMYSYGYGFFWTDRIYNLNLSTGATNLLSTISSSVTSQLPTYSNMVTPPPMPSAFTLPATVLDGVNLDVERKNPDGTTTTSTTTVSNFNKDTLGNKYKDSCLTNGYPYTFFSSCEVAKYSASGQKLWGYTGDFYSQAPVIDYISTDSSKLIVSGLRNAPVSNNNNAYVQTDSILNGSNGSEILRLYQTPNHSFFNHYVASFTTNNNYYLGVYDDVVAYIAQTVDSGFQTVVGAKARWELKFYHLVTGNTVSAGIIKEFIGKTSVGGGNDTEGTWIRATPASVISSDGKLIIANYYTNVLIYDMKTFAKEGDITTGMTDAVDVRSYGYHNSSSKSDSWSNNRIKGIALTQDGIVRIVYQYSFSGRGTNDDGSSDSDDRVTETALTIQTTPSSDNSYSYGYISGTDTITNGDLSLKVIFNKNTFSNQSGVGVGFRSQDHKNMYKVEVSTGQVSFVKVVEGIRTILASYAYPIKTEQTYTLKVKVNGTKVKVYMNGVPIIEKTDPTFTSGTFGLFAEVPYAVIKDFCASIHELTGDEVENLAIVNAPITYNKTYTDLENDPLLSDKTTWKFTNIQPYKFLNVGDGTSDPVGTNSYNGVIVRQPSPSLSKVGVYSVELAETDDPAPSGYKYPKTAFEEFRQESDPANHHIVVHRRPIAQFSLSINSTTQLVEWADTSYDPDRWLSATNYSSEATGIDYRTTRGVLERRYYFIDPDGKQVNRQLVVPTLAGEYTVAETVRDEFGAWSDWEEQTITIETPVINRPPTADVTVPASTDQNNPTKFAVVRPTFHWTYADEDGDPQSQYELRIMRYGGTLLLSSGIRTGTATSWVPSVDLPGGTNLYVQARVYDGAEWSDWSAPKFFSINRPPAADFDWSPKPVYEGDAVQFSTTASDPDNDTLAVGYEVVSPNGTKQTFSHSFHPPYSTHAGPSIRMQAVGTWTIRMTVSDGKAPEVIVTKTVQVGALGVAGAVKHTEAWERNRLVYNEKYDPDRPSGTFWAGEAYVLESTTTDTGASGTKAASVTVVAFGQQPKALGSTDAAKTRWNALYRSADTDIDFSLLTDGTYTFVFTATYTNGTVKSDAVTITVDETMDAYAKVHRLH